MPILFLALGFHFDVTKSETLLNGKDGLRRVGAGAFGTGPVPGAEMSPRCQARHRFLLPSHE
jgi:hypothetical protein